MLLGITSNNQLLLLTICFQSNYRTDMHMILICTYYTVPGVYVHMVHILTGSLCPCCSSGGSEGGRFYWRGDIVSPIYLIMITDELITILD